MTEEQLQAIWKRVENATEGNALRDANVLRNQLRIIAEDVPALLAEVERLRAELETTTEILLDVCLKMAGEDD